MADTIEKVSIIISKGSLEGIYPGLIMANGARAEGIEANLFFTFFGLDAIHAKRLEHIKVAAIGNPGMHMASLIGVLPGMSAIATHMMEKKMEALDIPDIHEFMESSGIPAAGCTPARLPSTSSDLPRTTSSSRSRGSSRSVSSTRWRPAVRSSSPEDGRPSRTRWI